MSGIGVATEHPEITAEIRSEWRQMRDFAGGDRAVKRQGEAYLLKPGGFKTMADGGAAAYRAYLSRAIVPEIVGPSVAALLGIVHSKETQIALPDSLSGLWENADGSGVPLETFHRRITANLLLLGRYGVLATAPADGGDPYLAGFSGDTIINWDADFFVLDETGFRRSGFAWEVVPRYLVLEIVDGRAVSTVWEGRPLAKVSEATFSAARGGPLTGVPFVVGNAHELSAAIRSPPLIGVANATLASYQLSADWRHQLFWSGQEVLVAINGAAPDVVGAGGVFEMRGEPGATPDLKYVSPSCSGIEAHERALDKMKAAAIAAGARLFENTAAGQESGEARRLRFTSETASIMSIAQVSAGILERALRNAALLAGEADPAAVIVRPPADLLDSTMSAEDFSKLFGVYQAGGMAWDTFYERGQAGGVFSAERTAEEELALIDNLLQGAPEGP